MKQRHWVIVIVLMTLPCLSLSQDITGSLEGLLLGREGDPVFKARIIVSGPNLQGNRESKSNERGIFRFPALPPGGYTIEIQHDLFEPITLENVVVRLGRTTSLGEVRLQFVVAQYEIDVTGTKPLLDMASTETGDTITTIDPENFSLPALTFLEANYINNNLESDTNQIAEKLGLKGKDVKTYLRYC